MEALLLPVLLATAGEPLVNPAVWAILTIDQEARGEPYEGKLAVAEVIRDRTLQRFASDGTVSGTVLRPFQFSGWNTSDPNRVKAARRAAILFRDAGSEQAEAIRAWHEAVTLGTSVAKGALHYHADYIKPPAWARLMNRVAVIGRHIFYVERGK